MPSTEAEFADRAERHRRELHVQCYRMLGSFEEAEDLVQETLLRAWRSRAELGREEWLRAWLYKIATNACLDAIKAKGRRVPSLGSFRDLPWLQPYPDRLLDEVAPAGEQPDAAIIARETIELTYVAVIQLLPPRQRAVLILRDVLDWPAAEVAAVLEVGVAAVNSALQRARATLREQLPPARREEWVAPAALTAKERRLLDGFVDTHMRADADGALALLADDIRVTMPPLPYCYDGLTAIAPLLTRAYASGMGDWHVVATRANRQPAAASYLRAPGETEWRAFKLDVLRVAGDRIAEITTFDARLFEAFGLARTL